MTIEKEGIEAWLEKLLPKENEEIVDDMEAMHLRGEHDDNEGYTIDANDRVIPNTPNCKLCQEREEMYARADAEAEDDVEIDVNLVEQAEYIHKLHADAAAQYAEDVYDMRKSYEKYYGKTPHITWSFKKTKQATVERKMNSLVRRMKPFYLTVTKPDDTIEEWYVDGGNWICKQLADDKYSKFVGHVRNVLPFIAGRRLKLGRKSK